MAVNSFYLNERPCKYNKLENNFVPKRMVVYYYCSARLVTIVTRVRVWEIKTCAYECICVTFVCVFALVVWCLIWWRRMQSDIYMNAQFGIRFSVRPFFVGDCCSPFKRFYYQFTVATLAIRFCTELGNGFCPQNIILVLLFFIQANLAIS